MLGMIGDCEIAVGAHENIFHDESHKNDPISSQMLQSTYAAGCCGPYVFMGHGNSDWGTPEPAKFAILPLGYDHQNSIII